MINKLFSRNAFVLALIALFGTICLLTINVSAHQHTDHDNLSIHDVCAQTMLGMSFYTPSVYTGAYANISNHSNIAVRYYLSSSNIVLWKGRLVFRQKSDPDKGWVQPNESKSFFPSLDINMTGGKKGPYTADGYVGLVLKFDFDGNGTFDDIQGVSSSAFIEFEYE